MKCNKLVMHQEVRQWQSFEKTVCDSYKRSASGEDQSEHHEYNMSKQDSWSEEIQKQYETDMNAKETECHTETVFDWNDATSASWNFPSANEIDHGSRAFVAEGMHHSKQGNGTNYNKIYWGNGGSVVSDLAAWVLMMIRANE